ncbi:phosphatase 2C-like domain-containing protein [Phaeosphaeriaceae sp. PMI808]|nr:phosphatase 2C-like domain-containing protein [Phaeosphaeriaceae sp. PMI808]
MLPVRLGPAIAPQQRTPACRAYLRQHHASQRALTGRGTRSQSRATDRVQWNWRAIMRQDSSRIAPGRCLAPNILSHAPKGSVLLKSGFPTKTVIVLLVLGGLVYFFVEVVEEEDQAWAVDMFSGFEQDQPLATPFHFYHTKEEVDHYLQHHIPDASATLKEPSVGQFLSEQFNKLAFGWSLSGEFAEHEHIPDTHGCRFRSNKPCEDYYAISTSPGTGSNLWNYWSIMDGHAGGDTAIQLQWTLIPYLSSALLGLPAHSSSMEVETTIKQAFLRLDKSIMDNARTAANWSPATNGAAIAALMPAISGSCALVAAFDPEKDTLRVACTGDSRAVLGRWDSSSQSYTTIPLSVDQTGFNQKEVERLAKEHPGEPDIIDPKTGRLLGMMVTRAFGDHRWKWDNEFVKTVQCKFWGSSPRPGSKTPPYMTAEPEVTETEIVRVDPTKEKGAGASKSDFMIMASDGLWDRMSSEHAVECVQEWLEAKQRGNGSVSNDPRLQSNPPVYAATSIEEEGIEFNVENGEVADWKATPEFFAIEDDNAAVCLARNALGGARRGLFLGVLSIENSPRCRSVVDDTTIMVVFFDKLGEQHSVESQETRTKSWWKLW